MVTIFGKQKRTGKEEGKTNGTTRWTRSSRMRKEKHGWKQRSSPRVATLNFTTTHPHLITYQISMKHIFAFATKHSIMITLRQIMP